jgi:hypothetical protein
MKIAPSSSAGPSRGLETLQAQDAVADIKDIKDRSRRPLLFLDIGSITGRARRGQRQALLHGVDVHARRPGDDAAGAGSLRSGGSGHSEQAVSHPDGFADSAQRKAVLPAAAGLEVF